MTNITGTGFADVLDGTDLDDNISGKQGDDLLRGKDGDDYLTGDAGADILIGGKGADSLFGGDGDDWMCGGKGSDILNGNTGVDTYQFDILNGDGAADLFGGFYSGTDRIVFNLTGGAIGTETAISSSEFVALPLHVALDFDDHYLYDTAEEALYYDPDGLGGAAASLVAVFSPGVWGHALAASDIFVI